MARALLQLLTLLLAFTMEVHIHASEPVWLSEPPKCTFNEAGCAFQARMERADLNWEDARISARKGTILDWSRSQVVRIARGTALVSLTEGKKIRVPTAEISGQGEILVERKGLATTVTCLAGEVLIRPLGSGENLRLPEGFVQDLDSVDGKGQAQADIPRTAPLAGSIKKWWSVFSGTKQEFLPLAKRFTKVVAANVDMTSRWHADMVQREIAAHAERERREAEARRQAAEERKQYRDLFRKMNYLGDSLPD